MPKLLSVNGPIYDVYLKEGQKITLEEAKSMLDGDIRVLELPDGYIFILANNDKPQKINKHSSNLWYAYTNDRDKLKGNVILCKKEQFEYETYKNGNGCSEECSQDNKAVI